MKKQTQRPSMLYSPGAFDRRIVMSIGLRGALLKMCTLIEEVEIIEIDEASNGKYESISLEIYAAPKEGSYPEGYVITDNWEYLIWHCDTYLELVDIIGKYRNYIPVALKERWPYLKTRKPEKAV